MDDIDDMPALIGNYPCLKENLVVGKRYYLVHRYGFYSNKVVEVIELGPGGGAWFKDIADEIDVNGVKTPGEQHYHDPNVDKYCWYDLFEYSLYEFYHAGH